MKITFQTNPNCSKHWTIFIDAQFWRVVHKTIFGRHPRLSSVELFDDYEKQRVKNYLIWRLSRQSYHSEQLGAFLRRYLVQEKTIRLLIDEFQENGIFNDESWLNQYMTNQLKRYQLRFVLNKLRLKGFSNETLESLRKVWNNQESDIQAILHQLQTRFRNKDFTDFKTKQKIIASLIRKGYHFEQVKEAFDKFLTVR